MTDSVNMNWQEGDGMAATIANLYCSWRSLRQTHLSRIAEVEQYIYATSTKDTTNSSNPWSHTTHIPKLTQIYDNLGANYNSALFNMRDFFTFDAAVEDDMLKGKRQAVVDYLTTKHDASGFKARMKTCLDNWVRSGNAFAQVEYVRETRLNPVTNAEETTYEGPRIVPISYYDIEFDPTGTEFAKTPKIVRAVQTMGAFLRSVEENPMLRYKPEGIEKVRMLRNQTAGFTSEDWQKFTQMNMDGFSSYGSYIGSGKVELLTFYGDFYDPTDNTLYKDHIITVADRRFILRCVPSSDYGNIGQIYHVGWRKRSNNLWAQGPLDNLVGMQYMIDHLENAQADAFDQMLSPDEVYIGQVQTIKEGPVRKHFIDDAEGDVKQLAPDATVLQADFKIQLKEAQMEAYAGAPREAMGIRTPGEKTKFEFATLTEAASRMFQVKIEDFEEGFVEPILNAELEIAQRNLSTPDLIKTFDNDFGAEMFKKITKDDITVKGKLTPRGASHYARLQRLVSELNTFSQVLANDPALAQHFPAQERAKLWEELLGFKRYGLMQPFGQIAENLEGQKIQQAAQDEMGKHMAGQAALGDAEMDAGALMASEAE